MKTDAFTISIESTTKFSEVCSIFRDKIQYDFIIIFSEPTNFKQFFLSKKHKTVLVIITITTYTNLVTITYKCKMI